MGNFQLDTPARRRKLPPAKAPVWVSIGQARSGLKLGYRKGPRGGAWIAKHVGKGTRRECTIGAADDAGAPEGALSFTAATQAAIAWTDGVKAQVASGGATTAITVKQAVDSYIAMRVARSARTGADARSRLGRHVLRDKIAGMTLASLTASALTDWRKRLDTELAPATVNRLINDLRAALRQAGDAHWRLLPTLPREVEHGLKAIPEASQARAIILPVADIRAAVEASFTVDVDLGVLVLLLAATGMRFSQIAALTVADVQPGGLRVMVPPSRKGRANKPKPRIAVPVGDDVIGHLRPLIAGRRGHEPLLLHWVHARKGANWERIRRAPWVTSVNMQRGWKKALALAGIEYAEPYALRHSSIVHRLTKGLPVRLVAAAHDTSIAMIEKYYSAYIVDAAEEMLRNAITPMATPAAARLRAVD